jgi:hypothetical protein
LPVYHLEEENPMATRPAETEYAPFYARYVALVPETEITAALEKQITDVERLAGRVSADRELYRYAEGKWCIREVIGHLIDGERVFAYRAFCFSRGEEAHLPSFDENAYVHRSRYHACPLADLLAEFTLLRKANLAFFRRLSDPDWSRTGTASTHPISVRALAFIMAGHVRHHLAILQSKYGVPAGA